MNRNYKIIFAGILIILVFLFLLKVFYFSKSGRYLQFFQPKKMKMVLFFFNFAIEHVRNVDNYMPAFFKYG